MDSGLTNTKAEKGDELLNLVKSNIIKKGNRKNLEYILSLWLYFN